MFDNDLADLAAALNAPVQPLSVKTGARDLDEFLEGRDTFSVENFADGVRFYRMLKHADGSSTQDSAASATNALQMKARIEGDRDSYEKAKEQILPDSYKALRDSARKQSLDNADFDHSSTAVDNLKQHLHSLVSKSEDDTIPQTAADVQKTAAQMIEDFLSGMEEPPSEKTSAPQDPTMVEIHRLHSEMEKAAALPDYLAKPMRGESLEVGSPDHIKNQAFGRGVGGAGLGGLLATPIASNMLVRGLDSGNNRLIAGSAALLAAGMGGGAALGYSRGKKRLIEYYAGLSDEDKARIAKGEMPLKKNAGMSFTKQDRPEKVKEIYRALKRDHPNMPAEMKARIAARQGKPGKQKQGPPYAAPIKKAQQLTNGEERLRIPSVREQQVGTLGVLGILGSMGGVISADALHNQHVINSLEGARSRLARSTVGAADLRAALRSLHTANASKPRYLLGAALGAGSVVGGGVLGAAIGNRWRRRRAAEKNATAQEQDEKDRKARMGLTLGGAALGAYKGHNTGAQLGELYGNLKAQEKAFMFEAAEEFANQIKAIGLPDTNTDHIDALRSSFLRAVEQVPELRKRYGRIGGIAGGIAGAGALGLGHLAYTRMRNRRDEALSGGDTPMIGQPVPNSKTAGLEGMGSTGAAIGMGALLGALAARAQVQAVRRENEQQIAARNPLSRAVARDMRDDPRAVPASMVGGALTGGAAGYGALKALREVIK